MIHYFFYNLVVVLVLFLALPLLPFILLVPSWRIGLRQRLGTMPADVMASAAMAERRVWVHAASVGEVNAVAQVVADILKKIPQAGIIVSCTSLAGVEHARRLIPEALAHVLMPLDAGFFLRPMLRWFKPGLAIIVETELWPNFVRLLSEQGSIVMVANGRLSKRSYGRYLLAKPLFSEVLRHIHTVAAQSRADADRFIGLGASPRRVTVLGNTKFDLSRVAKAGEEKAGSFREELGLKKEQELIIAGSTRPGEEEAMLKAFQGLRRSRPQAVLLLAPRHLERLEEVAGIARKAGLETATRQGLRQGRGQGAPVILLDTLGELAWAYAAAKLAWIGGSFADHGGQNPLEPACHGVPVFFGPFMSNFAEAASVLRHAGGAKRLDSAQELAQASDSLLADEKARKAMGQAGMDCLRLNSGASAQTAALACKLLLITDMKAHSQDWRAESLRREAMPREFGDSLENQDY